MNKKRYCEDYGIPKIITKENRDEILDLYCKNDILDIPYGVEEIGNSAFRHCDNFRGITIPDSVVEIGVGAFSWCGNLERINIPDSITKISILSFWCCTHLKEINIPNSITEIEREAFSGCDSLEEITVPDSVTRIYKEAFSWCRKLKKVIIENPDCEIDKDIFAGCFKLDYDNSYIGDKTLREYFGKKESYIMKKKNYNYIKEDFNFNENDFCYVGVCLDLELYKYIWVILTGKESIEELSEAIRSLEAFSRYVTIDDILVVDTSSNFGYNKNRLSISELPNICEDLDVINNKLADYEDYKPDFIEFLINECSYDLDFIANNIDDIFAHSFKLIRRGDDEESFGFSYIYEYCDGDYNQVGEQLLKNNFNYDIVGADEVYYYTEECEDEEELNNFLQAWDLDSVEYVSNEKLESIGEEVIDGLYYGEVTKFLSELRNDVDHYQYLDFEGIGKDLSSTGDWAYNNKYAVIML